MNQQTKIALLAVLMVVAVAIFYFDSKDTFDFRGRTSPLDTRTPYSPLPIENPELQRWKLDASRHTEYKSSGRDIFSEVLAAPPRPKDPPRTIEPTGPQLPVAPPPPTLPPNMKYFGYGTVPNGTSKRAFLTDGEDVFIVGEGDTLLGRFRIIKIGNTALEFEELGTGRRGSTPLDEQAAPQQ